MDRLTARRTDNGLAYLVGVKPDDNEVLRDILVPMFDHKVTSTLQYKTELNGFVDGSDYELVWDPDVMEYVMRLIQDSLFDE